MRWLCLLFKVLMHGGKTFRTAEYYVQVIPLHQYEFWPRRS